MASHALGELDLAALESLAPEAREQAKWAIERLQRGAEVNPLWGYIPHAKQRTYHEIATMIGAFVGGNRSGKSYGGTADDVIQVVDAECLPPWLVPFKRWEGECHRRVGTPNLRTTLKKTVLPLFKRLIPRDQLWKKSWDRAYNGEDRVLTLANGNTVDFLTYEMDVDAWAGAELHGIRFDEEPKGFKGRTIFEESMMRLLSTKGEFRMTFTPLLGLSWSYYELTVPAGDGQSRAPRWDDETRVVTVDMDDNSHLDEETKRLALSRIPAAQLAARKSGRFIHFAGVIYPEWDPERHVVATEPIPRREVDGKPLVEVYVGIDPGRDHPAAAVWAYVAQGGRLVVFDTLKCQGFNAEEFCAEIVLVNERHRVKPRWYVIDPSARNKQHITGRSVQDEYRRCGIHTIPGQNSHDAGFERVSRLLKGGPVDLPVSEREPRLVIQAHCSNPVDDELPGLIEEFPMYRWAQRRQGEGASPQKPIKINDDLLDALRYLVMSNPTGLTLPDEEDLPPVDPAKFDEWDRRRKLREHVTHLAKRAKRPLGRRAVGTVR